MNLIEFEKDLESYIGGINLLTDINYVKQRLKFLFTIINQSSENIHVEVINIAKNVAIAYTYFENAYNFTNQDKPVEEFKDAYDFIITGFFNFLKSPKYFNQEIVLANEDMDTCISIELIEPIVTTYINSSMIALIRGALGLSCKEINDFETELIKQSLLDNYYSKFDKIESIRIEIDTQDYCTR